MPDGGLVLNIVYDESAKQFRQNGRVVSNQAVRAEIDKLTAFVSKEAQRIGKKYADGKIGIAQFEIEMRELLKSSHLVASSVGRGGRARMSQADWGKVGSRLKREYTYLQKFARKLAQGKIAKAVTPNRAKSYSSSVVMSYHETMRTEQTQNSVTDIKVRLIQNSKEGCSECTADADRGWVAVEDMQEIGTRICQNFCLCEFEFSDDVNE